MFKIIILKINKIEKDFWRFFSSNEIFSHNLNTYKSSKVCSISAANLPADYVAQVLLDFCCQSAVLLCEQILSKNGSRMGSQLMSACWHFLISNLLPVCRQSAYILFGGICTQIIYRILLGFFSYTFGISCTLPINNLNGFAKVLTYQFD